MGMNAVTEAAVGLMVFGVVMYTVVLVWQPIVVDNLYPLLENSEAFTHGATAVTIFQVIILIVVAAALIAFFNQARGADRPPQYGYGY